MKLKVLTSVAILLLLSKSAFATETIADVDISNVLGNLDLSSLGDFGVGYLEIQSNDVLLAKNNPNAFRNSVSTYLKFQNGKIIEPGQSVSHLPVCMLVVSNEQGIYSTSENASYVVLHTRKMSAAGQLGDRTTDVRVRYTFPLRRNQQGVPYSQTDLACDSKAGGGAISIEEINQALGLWLTATFSYLRPL